MELNGKHKINSQMYTLMAFFPSFGFLVIYQEQV